MIFVDTSFWIAFQNRRDDLHSVATQLIAEHNETALVTSNHVRGETWTFLCRRAGHAVAVDFLNALDRTARVRILPVHGEAEMAAWSWLRRHDERPYSFVDATSFELMRRLEIFQALAFDGDFSAAGFYELRPG